MQSKREGNFAVEKEEEWKELITVAYWMIQVWKRENQSKWNNKTEIVTNKTLTNPTFMRIFILCFVFRYSADLCVWLHFLIQLLSICMNKLKKLSEINTERVLMKSIALHSSCVFLSSVFSFALFLSKSLSVSLTHHV